MKKIVIGTFIVIFLLASHAQSATYYVDGSLVSDCAGGAGTSYSVALRNCSASDGTKAYTALSSF